MKQTVVKLTLILLFLVTFPKSILADGSQEGLGKKINGYQVELVFATGQAQTGSNELAIKLHDQAGIPLSNAIVKVSVVRPGEASHNEPSSNNHTQAQVDHTDGVDSHTGNSGNHSAANMVAHAEEATQAETVHADAGANDHNQGAQDSHGTGHNEENTTVQLIAHSQSGEYTGQVEFADTGEWLVKVNFEVAGKVEETSFVVEAVQNGSKWLVINSFLGINVLVVMAAAITKRYFSPKTRKGIS